MTIKLHRGQLTRGLTPTMLSVAVRAVLFHRFGWISTNW